MSNRISLLNVSRNCYVVIVVEVAVVGGLAVALVGLVVALVGLTVVGCVVGSEVGCGFGLGSGV